MKSATSEANTAEEVEVTPEMIEAGVDALAGFSAREDLYGDAVRDVFRAMMAAHQFKRVNPIMRAQAMSMRFGLKNGSFSTWRSLLHAITPRRSKAPVKGGLWLSAASARLILL